MTRLNLILFFTLIFSSLGLVNAQHEARKLYIELDQMNQDAKQYEQEYGQLQLEQSTWAMHSRVERIATEQLQMQVPDPKRIQVVTMGDVQSKVSSGVKPKAMSEAKPQEQLEVKP
ncbi:cell division protein FtsL [mine drainage metagenome]|uniref:Cell division protein FtsL n=1 Tax=mine drainage metagenome TaxID=410659 RepID=A0A1J5SEF0_9ZZZZ